MSANGKIRAAFVAPEGIELKLVQRPRIEDGAIMVKMKASGICGTDLEKISGHYSASTVLGHEVSGIVVESKSPDFQEGESVVPHHHVACGVCYFCAHGAETMCARFHASNFEPGGFADEFRVPEYSVKRGGVHRLARISFEEASFAEPLACCLRALNSRVMDFRGMENVLIVGAGPVGLLHMEILRTKVPDLRIVAADVSLRRVEFAEKNEGATGLEVRKNKDGSFASDALKQIPVPGYDLVIVATGNPAAFKEAVRCVRKSGTVQLFGAPHSGSSYILDLQSMLLNELTLTTSYATTEKELGEALSLLESGKISVKKFVTARFPLEEVSQAMAAASSESEVKVLVCE